MRRADRGSRLALAILALAMPGLTPPARAEPVPTVGVAVLVATEQGKAAAAEAWVDAQLEEANRLYAAVPLRFRRVAWDEAAIPARLTTRGDRDQAMGRLARGVVNLRVVAALLDVDEPGRVRRGVHWRQKGDATRRYILLSAIAPPGVLAHELGHYFGNGHSPVPDNLMSYERSGGPVSFDEAQLARVRRALHEALRSGELRALR